MRPCTHCHGTGMVRSIESMALFVLRGIETAGVAGKSSSVLVTVPADIDLYLLNQKRSNVLALENRYEMSIMIQRDSKLIAPDFKIETTVTRSKIKTKEIETIIEPEVEDEILEDIIEETEETAESEETVEHKQRERGRRNPFQRRRGKDRRDKTEQPTVEATSEEPAQQAQETEEAAREEKQSRNRRRRNRNRNRNRGERIDQTGSEAVASETAPTTSEEQSEMTEKSGRNRRRRRKPNRPHGSDDTEQSSNLKVVKSDTTEKSENTSDDSETTGDGKKRRRGFWRRLLEA